jgi:hypothetical protein
LEHFGIVCNILEHFGIVCNILEYFGTFWHIFPHFGIVAPTFWNILDFFLSIQPMGHCAMVVCDADNKRQSECGGALVNSFHFPPADLFTFPTVSPPFEVQTRSK